MAFVVPSAPGHRRHDGLDALGEADTVVVPGYFPLHDPSPPVLAALRSAAERGSRIASICIGAFALASRACSTAGPTHWQEAGHFRARFPAVRLNPDVLYVDEGQLLTSAGLSAGIDLCLYMVRLDYGAGPATIQAPGPGPGARPGKR